MMQVILGSSLFQIVKEILNNIATLYYCNFVDFFKSLEGARPSFALP